MLDLWIRYSIFWIFQEVQAVTMVHRSTVAAATAVRVSVARARLPWHYSRRERQTLNNNNNAMSGCCAIIRPLKQWPLSPRLAAHTNTTMWAYDHRHCYTASTTTAARIPTPTKIHCPPLLHRLLLLRRSSSTWSTATSSTDSTLLPPPQATQSTATAAEAMSESEPQQQRRRLVMQQCQELHRSIMDLNERVRWVHSARARSCRSISQFFGWTLYGSVSFLFVSILVFSLTRAFCT
jgi:hypothetical protein